MTLTELRKMVEEMEKEYGGDTIVKFREMDGSAPRTHVLDDIWMDTSDVLHMEYEE